MNTSILLIYVVVSVVVLLGGVLTMGSLYLENQRLREENEYLRKTHGYE